MADNLIQLQEDVETFIDPNGLAGSILAENHQNILKGVLNKVGKYVGSPYLATKNEASLVPGVMSWNGNAMNNTNVFEIQFASLTADLNDFGLILGTLTEGDLIRFKDSVGRSVFLEFVSYQKIFVASLEICKVNVKGRAENINYIYQDDERLICVIETYKQNSSGAVYDLEYDSPNLILKENGVEKNSINRSIQIQDGDGVSKFDISDFVQIQGASFNSANRRISINPITANTIYIDGLNGDDLSGELGDVSRPFKTFSGALLVKPDNEFFTFYILEDLLFDAIPTSETFIFSERSVDLDFSLLTGAIGANNDLVIYAPNGRLIHKSPTVGGRVTFRYQTINIKVLEFEMDSDTSLNHLFEADAGSKSNVSANTIRILNGGGTRVRGSFLNINVKSNIFISDRDYIVSSSTTGTFDINRLETERLNIIFGNNSLWDSVFVKQPHELFVSNLNWFGSYDASKSIIQSGNIRINGNELTGRENQSNIGTIEIFNSNNLRIHNFFGKLKSRLVGGYTIYPTSPNCNVQILDSKIICDDDFMRTNPNNDYSSAIFIIRNLEVEFTSTGKELFHDINPAGIIVKRTGFLEANGTLGSPVTLTNNLENSF